MDVDAFTGMSADALALVAELGRPPEPDGTQLGIVGQIDSLAYEMPMAADPAVEEQITSSRLPAGTGLHDAEIRGDIFHATPTLRNLENSRRGPPRCSPTSRQRRETHLETQYLLHTLNFSY